MSTIRQAAPKGHFALGKSPRFEPVAACSAGKAECPLPRSPPLAEPNVASLALINLALFARRIGQLSQNIAQYFALARVLERR
jgi:hypothetical protein